MDKCGHQSVLMQTQRVWDWPQNYPVEWELVRAQRKGD